PRGPAPGRAWCMPFPEFCAFDSFPEVSAQRSSFPESMPASCDPAFRSFTAQHRADRHPFILLSPKLQKPSMNSVRRRDSPHENLTQLDQLRGSKDSRDKDYGEDGLVPVNVAQVLIKVLPPERRLLVLVVKDSYPSGRQLMGDLLHVASILTGEGAHDVIAAR